MRTKFAEYYPIPNEEFKTIWKNCWFVFDTNVLLDFYRLSFDKTHKIITFIKDKSDQIWIPYQVAKEYHANLFEVVEKQIDVYDNSVNKINEIKGIFTENKLLAQYCTDDQRKQVLRACRSIERVFDAIAPNVERLITNNKLMQDIAQLLEGKVGHGFSEDELNQIYLEGKMRYQNQIPPGYKDQAKGNNRYGDLVIWKEILQQAQNTNKSIVFITRDVKEDWFFRNRGKTIGPNIKLRVEFHDKVGVGQNVFYHSYSLEQFLKYASQYDDFQYDQELESEIKNLLGDEDKHLCNNFVMNSNDDGIIGETSYISSGVTELCNDANDSGNDNAGCL